MLKVKDGYSKVIGTAYQGSPNYLLLSDGSQKAVNDFALAGSSYTKTESDAKYITDITTTVNTLTFIRNASSVDRNITVNVVLSLGRRDPLDERNAISGIYTYSTYSSTANNLAPASYFETLGFGQGTAGSIEIGGSWISNGLLYWRALRDTVDSWFDWKTILDSENSYVNSDGRGIINGSIITYIDNSDKLDGKHASDFASAIHTHTWQSITNKVVNANEFNIVNAGFNSTLYVNYAPIDDSSKTANISSYYFCNGNRSYATLYSKGYIKSGSNDTYVLLGGGGHKALTDFSMAHSHPYLPLAGGDMYDGALIKRISCGCMWYLGRLSAMLRETSAGGYHALWSLKTTNGSWELGEYNETNFTDVPVLSYITDTDYTAGNNTVTYLQKFLLKNGEIALTNDIGNGTITINLGGTYKGSFSVNLSGNTTINLDSGSSDSATSATRLLVNTEFAKGNNFLLYFNTANLSTSDIVGNAAPDSDWWHIIRMNHGNTNGYFSELAIALNSFDGVYWRTISNGSVKKSWTRLANADEVVSPSSYYWANVKVSSASSTTTSPTVSTIYASNWFRSTGSTGWYNLTYEGGWYMSDAFWVRSHADKNVYTGGNMKAAILLVFNNNRDVLVAILDSSNNFILGLDTTYNSIVSNTYLRGNIVNFLVKTTDSSNYTAFLIFGDLSLSNNFFEMRAGATVSDGDFSVLNNSWICKDMTTYTDDDEIYKSRLYVGNNLSYDISIGESYHKDELRTSQFHFVTTNGIISQWSLKVDTGIVVTLSSWSCVATTIADKMLLVTEVDSNTGHLLLYVNNQGTLTNYTSVTYRLRVIYVSQLPLSKTIDNYSAIKITPNSLLLWSKGNLALYKGGGHYELGYQYLYFGDLYWKLPVFLFGLKIYHDDIPNPTIIGPSNIAIRSYSHPNTGVYAYVVNLPMSHYSLSDLMLQITGTGAGDTSNNAIDARGILYTTGTYLGIQLYGSDDASLNDFDCLLMIWGYLK